MPELRLENLSKNYGKVQAVAGLDLTVKDGEFMVFVGPSGCGKTTTLRMIAGLEEISSGDIYLDDRRINDVPSKDRDMAMVFQDYALYPHMTVFDNIAFGLKMRRVEKAEIAKRVKRAAEQLGIKGLLKRRPHALSGGERQRVALGRAIVRDPKVFLFDEPLSNLDAALRVQMREELLQLHRELKTTFVYVTHDQIEAMTMASRIAVMDGGVLQQCDAPAAVYRHPANVFVARFIGSPQMSLLDCFLAVEDGAVHCYAGGGRLRVPDKLGAGFMERQAIGRPLILGMRPEHIRLNTQEGLAMTVRRAENTGSDTYLYLAPGGTTPEWAAPGVAASEGAASEWAAPGGTTPEWAAPGVAASEGAASEWAAPGVTAPGGTVSERAVSGGTVSGGAGSKGAAPEKTAPKGAQAKLVARVESSVSYKAGSGIVVCPDWEEAQFFDRESGENVF